LSTQDRTTVLSTCARRDWRRFDSAVDGQSHRVVDHRVEVIQHLAVISS
jgi:hypothetical protein